MQYCTECAMTCGPNLDSSLDGLAPQYRQPSTWIHLDLAPLQTAMPLTESATLLTLLQLVLIRANP